MGIGANLKRILDERKMKVSELSRKSGVTPQTIYAIIKRDNDTVKPEILNKLAIALGIPIGDLMDIQTVTFDLKKIIQAIDKSLDEDDKSEFEMKFEEYIKEQDLLDADNKERHHLIIYHYDTLNRIGRDALLEILSSLKILNDIGIEEAVKRVEELTQIEKYKQ